MVALCPAYSMHCNDSDIETVWRPCWQPLAAKEKMCKVGERLLEADGFHQVKSVANLLVVVVVASGSLWFPLVCMKAVWAS